MLIEELSRKDCVAFLTRARLGRLACARGGQPYVVPMYFRYEDGYLYTFSTAGQKIDWMRANPRVCVEVDEVGDAQQWRSVVVLGQYEELTDTPGRQRELAHAHRLLSERNIWWEPAYAKTQRQGAERPLAPVFFRVHVTELSGHFAH